MSAKMCTPERAQSIVDLLLNDPGTARCYVNHRASEDDFALSEVVCKGCGEMFMQKAVGRQYCGRQCYDNYLQRRRDAKPPKPPKVDRAEGSPFAVGAGNRFAGDAAAYCYSRAGQPVTKVQAEILKLYGYCPGITTIYRCWRRKSPPNASGPLPEPPVLDGLPVPVEPEPAPIPEEQSEEIPMPTQPHPENTIAERLKAALAKQGVSQFTAAEAAGVSQSTFSRLVRGLTCQEDTYADVMRWLNYSEGKAVLEEGVEGAQPRKKAGRPRAERPDYTKERKLVSDALAKAERTASWLSREIGFSQPSLSSWLTRGLGIGPDKVAALVAWAESVFALPEEPEELPAICELPLAVLKEVATNSAIARAIGEEGDTLPPASAQEKITPATFGDWDEGDGFEPDPHEYEEPLAEQEQSDLALVQEAEDAMCCVTCGEHAFVGCECVDHQVDSMAQALEEMRTAPLLPPVAPRSVLAESPADAILTAHLERVARAALQELAPDLVDQVELGILLAWKGQA